MITSAVNLGL